MSGAPERRDFLVEIGTEELPPKALHELEKAFAEGMRAQLAAAKLKHGEIRSFASPRRLAVRVRRLAARQLDLEVKRRGPPLSLARDAQGAWTRAALAFAQSNGVAAESLVSVTEARGEFLYFVGTKAGDATVDLLPEIVRASLAALPTPKRMRWGAGEAEFVRPVHWIVMLYGRDVVPARLFDIDSGAFTRGHRFHAPKPIKLIAPASYEGALAKRGYVLADFAVRRERVREQVNAAAAALGGRAVTSESLLDEVSALVEWPVPVSGHFDARFLALPREVLISTLQTHQRYFAVEDAHGKLLARFIAVSNIDSRDPKKVREGNERVVRPRLTDAAFFWEQDRKQPLDAYRAGLAAVTFQAKLGSLGDRTARMRSLAGEIATALSDPRGDSTQPRELAERAAELSKCDLLSAMVGEFPDLQGIMGAYYALADGEPSAVSTAIREHYLPRGAGDELPGSAAGCAVALADKLDTLAGIFAIGQKPTGAKDPFGLRRAAIGVLRILIEKRLDLDLLAFIERAVALQPATGVDSAASANVAGEVHEFVFERLRSYYAEGTPGHATAQRAHVTGEMFDAVHALRPRSLFDFDARLNALGGFLQMPEAASLTAAHKRIANILRKSAGTQIQAAYVDAALLREPAECELHDALQNVRDGFSSAVAARDYVAALGLLARLRPQVDAFFDGVMVMDPDAALRGNRLALLTQLSALFSGVADLSRLPG